MQFEILEIHVRPLQCQKLAHVKPGENVNEHGRLARLNALTYEVDGPRTKMLRTGQSSFGIDQDFAVPLITFAVLVTCATRMYPRMTEQAVHSSVRIKVNQSGLRVCSFDRG